MRFEHCPQIDSVVFNQCHQCCQLEHRPRIALSPDCIVVDFGRLPLGVPLQVHHRTDCPCLHLHHDGTSSLDDVPLKNPGLEFPCDGLLDVHVKGGPDVKPVDRSLAVLGVVLDLSSPVCLPVPFETLLSVKQVVVPALDSYVSAFEFGVVPDITDCPEGKFAVGVLSRVDLIHDESAFVGRLVEQRESLEFLQCLKSHRMPYAQVGLFACPFFCDCPVVFVRGLVPEDPCKSDGEFSGLFKPFGLKFFRIFLSPEPVPADCTVHCNLVVRDRDREQSPVVCQDGSPFRFKNHLPGFSDDIVPNFGCRLEGETDLYQPDEYEGSKNEKQNMCEHQNDTHPVLPEGFVFGLYSCPLLFHCPISSL